jgi:hypothetical protein
LLVIFQERLQLNFILRLYSVQFSAAQEEIYRAQDILRVVDRQRYQAEKDAANSRSIVRKLNQDIIINAAREEGRRMGLREGLERGRNLGFQEAQYMARLSRTEEDAEFHDGDDFADYIERPRRRSGFITLDEDLHHLDPPPRNTSPSSPARPLPPDPIPIPPPEVVNRAPGISSASYRHGSPSVRQSLVSIPPDGYIPALDADHFIRIPPPHELSRPPPTPERKQSPALPESQGPTHADEIPRDTTPHRVHKARRQSSPGSSSTTLSQFEMVNDPDHRVGRRSPLSVIHEVLSVHTSPNTESIKGHELKHQSSWVSNIVISLV